MTIQKAIRVQVWAISDGTSTSFTFDLAIDPYWIGSATTSGIGGRIMNWFAEAGETGASMPVGVIIVEGATNATLAGTIVTVTVPIQPIGHKYVVTLDMLFGDASSPPPAVTTDPPVNVDQPFISGLTGANGTLGDLVSCTMGNWDNMFDEPHSYAYQWMRLDMSVAAWGPIDGETDPTYTVADADNGNFIRCDVTATNVAGSTLSESNDLEVVFGGTSGQTQRTKKR